MSGFTFLSFRKQQAAGGHEEEVAERSHVGLTESPMAAGIEWGDCQRRRSAGNSSLGGRCWWLVW